MLRLIIVTKKETFFKSVLSEHNIKYKIFTDKNELDKFVPNLRENDILISYNHNIIFSKEILSKIKVGYNIHSGSPEFPGRDPHHWAIYNYSKKYGAVMHVIEENVDAGGIIDTSSFDINSNMSPLEVLFKADIESQKLISNLIESISKNEQIKINNSIKWGENKKSRKDFNDICHIPFDISKNELELRIKAFHVEGRKNLYTIIRGRKFYF